jgi:Uma2 family endonuclease
MASPSVASRAEARIETDNGPKTMATATKLAPADARRVITDMDWDDYERLDDAGLYHRIAYDGTNIEMLLILSAPHEGQASWVDLFIWNVTSALKIRRQPMGSTTWRRKHLNRAIEPDSAYYFDPAKMAALAAADQSKDIDLYPNPDLVVEVDISRPKIDRPGIYAALQVPEMWRVRDRTVSIEHLGPDGRYIAAARSLFLPVTPADVTHWVFIEDKSDSVQWEDRLRAWAGTIAGA